MSLNRPDEFKTSTPQSVLQLLLLYYRAVVSLVAKNKVGLTMDRPFLKGCMYVVVIGYFGHLGQLWNSFRPWLNFVNKDHSARQNLNRGVWLEDTHH